MADLLLHLGENHIFTIRAVRRKGKLLFSIHFIDRISVFRILQEGKKAHLLALDIKGHNLVAVILLGGQLIRSRCRIRSFAACNRKRKRYSIVLAEGDGEDILFIGDEGALVRALKRGAAGGEGEGAGTEKRRTEDKRENFFRFFAPFLFIFIFIFQNTVNGTV